MSCNGGGGGGGSTGSGVTPPSPSANTISYDYNNKQQYATPYFVTSSKSIGFPCIKVVNFIAEPDKSGNSVVGEFDLINNCSTSQNLSGLQITYSSVNRSIALHPQNLSVNYISGVSLAQGETDSSVYTTSASRANYIMTTLNTKAVLNAANLAHFTYSYKSEAIGSDAKNFRLSVTGQTPTHNSTLNVILDTTDLNSVCHTANSCSFTLHIYGQGGNFYENQTITNDKDGKTIYKFEHLNPGEYVVSLSGLPKQVQATFSNAEKFIQLDSGEVQDINIRLSPSPTGTGSFKVSVVNPESSLFGEIPMVAHYQDKYSSASLFNKDSYQGIIYDVPVGDCLLEINGVADAGSGKYYNFPLHKFEVIENHISEVGPIEATKIEPELVSEIFEIVGLDKHDSVELVFTDALGYKFNRETLTENVPNVLLNATFKFVKGDRVTVNLIPSNKTKYKPFAPITFTVTENQSIVFNILQSQ